MMITPNERDRCLRDGFLYATAVLDADQPARIRTAFDQVWDAESPAGKINQPKLLKYQPFFELIEHPPILDRHRAIFGKQVQLLQYALLPDVSCKPWRSVPGID